MQQSGSLRVFAYMEKSTVTEREKKEAVAALNEVFKKTSVVVVAHYSGLTVAQMQNLRKMRDAGATVRSPRTAWSRSLDGTDAAPHRSLMKGRP